MTRTLIEAGYVLPMTERGVLILFLAFPEKNRRLI